MRNQLGHDAFEAEPQPSRYLPSGVSAQPALAIKAELKINSYLKSSLEINLSSPTKVFFQFYNANGYYISGTMQVLSEVYRASIGAGYLGLL